MAAVVNSEDSRTRWVVGVAVAVVGIVVSALVTLIAAGKLGCPSWLCDGGSEPDPGRPSTSVSIVLKPAAGPVGSTVGVSLTGFQPGETVKVRLDDAVIGTLVADGDGAVRDNPLTIPRDAQPGVVSVFAEGSASRRSANTTFELVP